MAEMKSPNVHAKKNRNDTPRKRKTHTVSYTHLYRKARNQWNVKTAICEMQFNAVAGA